MQRTCRDTTSEPICLIDGPYLAIINLQLPFRRPIQSGMFVSEQTLWPRLSRLSLTLVAAVGVLPFFTARTATATCGDYVTVAGTRHQESHSMPTMPHCTGPNCQRKVPPPALPTKALPTFQYTDSAYCAQLDGSSDPPFVHAVVEQGLTLPEGHLLDLLRPPCA